MRVRKPSPPSTKASATLRPVEPCPVRKCESSCPSGFPPPVHAKSARRPAEIIGYIAEDDAEAATRFGNSLLDHVDLLARFPRMGSSLRTRANVRRLLHSPVLVYYEYAKKNRLSRCLTSGMERGSRQEPSSEATATLTTPTRHVYHSHVTMRTSAYRQPSTSLTPGINDTNSTVLEIGNITGGDNSAIDIGNGSDLSIRICNGSA